MESEWLGKEIPTMKELVAERAQGAEGLGGSAQVHIHPPRLQRLSV